jgi:2-polyprenyl-3-methyl-5-hydroxy-6-metoxy-1,4-benzoquinol methylase
VRSERGYRVTWNNLRTEPISLVKLKYESGHVEFVPGNLFEIGERWAGRFDAVLGDADH